MAYYAQLSCEFTRDPRMIAAGWQARAVYVEAMLYCRENLTDGLIDRLALIFWMPDMPVKARAKLLDRLADVGALAIVDQGWRFPSHVWSKWNPSKADVEAKREAEAQRKAEWRARRRAESGVSPNGTDSGHRVTATDGPRQTERETKRETETKGKRETERENYSSSSKVNLGSDEAETTTEDLRIKEVIGLLADQQIRDHGQKNPVSPKDYRESVETNLERNHGDTIRRTLADRPDHEPRLLADLLALEIR